MTIKAANMINQINIFEEAPWLALLEKKDLVMNHSRMAKNKICIAVLKSIWFMRLDYLLDISSVS
jgi:hypothetical protein